MQREGLASHHILETSRLVLNASSLSTDAHLRDRLIKSNRRNLSSEQKKKKIKNSNRARQATTETNTTRHDSNAFWVRVQHYRVVSTVFVPSSQNPCSIPEQITMDFNKDMKYHPQYRKDSAKDKFKSKESYYNNSNDILPGIFTSET